MENNSIQMLANMPITMDIVCDIRSILEEARRVSLRAVNSTMVFSYWLIGKRIIIEEQQGKDRAAYGEKILKKLSVELTSEFGEGFSYANLKNMRQFYKTYPNEKGYTLCSQLVSSIDTRSFVKDPYVLEFVGLPPYPEHKEKPLEDALMDNMQQFLLELGKGFSFVKRQYRIATETSEFFIDLVFYNYILKCFVLVDLKAAKLTHQDVGQMDMYIRMFDDLKRGEGDNPTIGILMCAEKDETVVKYSVLEGSKQIFASKYLPYLPSEEEIRCELEKRPILDK